MVIESQILPSDKKSLLSVKVKNYRMGKEVKTVKETYAKQGGVMG
jgi:hypothetical protein